MKDSPTAKNFLAPKLIVWRLRNADFQELMEPSVYQEYVHACLVVSDSLQPHQGPLSMGFPRQEPTGVGCHFLLQGIFPTQGSNPCLLNLPHWQAGSLSLVPPGSNIMNMTDKKTTPRLAMETTWEMWWLRKTVWSCSNRVAVIHSTLDIHPTL